MRRILIWSALAVLGLALTVAVTIAAGELSGQSIGLSAEPLDAGQTLAPPTGTTARTTTTSPTPAPATSTTKSKAPMTPPGDDDPGGSGELRDAEREGGNDD